jgi:hypothetical protein
MRPKHSYSATFVCIWKPKPTGFVVSFRCCSDERDISFPFTDAVQHSVGIRYGTLKDTGILPHKFAIGESDACPVSPASAIGCGAVSVTILNHDSVVLIVEIVCPNSFRHDRTTFNI